MISLEERYQNFKKTIQECGSYLLTESDDILEKSIVLRNSFMQLEKNVELLSVEAVRTFEEWKRLLRASDEIRKLLYW